MNSENSGQKQAGRWQPGQSGNPNGKPPGTKNHATRAALALLEGEAENLTRRAVELALSGDTTALRLCLERIAAPIKGRHVNIDLPPIERAEDVLAALTAIVQAVSSGEITPEEAATIAGVLETKRRLIETVEIERRLTALEEGNAKCLL